MLSAVRRSFRAPKLEDALKAAKENPLATPKHRDAIKALRDIIETKQIPAEQLAVLGVVPITVDTLRQPDAKENKEEKFSALWILRYLADSEAGAAMVLQEPNAIETLVDAIMNAHVGSENAKRSLETMRSLALHPATQILLGRDDVFKCVTAALAASPADASNAIVIYHALSEAGTGGSPHYASAMATDKALGRLRGLSSNAEIPEHLRAMASATVEHLDTRLASTAGTAGVKSVLAEADETED